jgi:hypothetical protein
MFAYDTRVICQQYTGVSKINRYNFVLCSLIRNLDLTVLITFARQ